ncbi:MAG: tetratricopeptide repeat protein [Deltaproteobacteria bacterium]|nr:tetratricopeptide repeat protein [Deltaproteobacteria bacterium]
MEAKELIKSGKLTEARQQLVEAVKKSPGDLASRTLLFQVLCSYGEWDKADRHLDAIAAQDPSREAGVLGYKNLIQAEKKRVEVIEKNCNASFLTQTPVYLELLSVTRERLAEKKVEDARELLKQIDGFIPEISGKVNDTPFTGFCDTDTLLFPFLEAFAHDNYIWVPFEAIRELSIPAPKTLLDLLWIPAHVTTWEGYAMNCYLPALYPNTFRQENERIKLGRVTDWLPLEGGFARGVGQHVFAVGDREMAILEIREVVFNFPGKEMSDDEENN